MKKVGRFLLSALDIVFGHYELILILAFLGIILWFWIASSPIFENKVVTKARPLPVEVQFIVNYYTKGEVVYDKATIEAELVEVKTIDWQGNQVSTYCELRAKNFFSEKLNLLVERANKILLDSSLPLRYEIYGTSGFEEFVDCHNPVYTHKVFVEVAGVQRKGEFLYINKPGFDHEEAWVFLPGYLYDQVLLAAIEEDAFEMSDYVLIDRYRGTTLALSISESGDPNGLGSWVESWIPILEYVYGGPLKSSSQTGDVEIVVGHKKVKSGEHRECVLRVEGNCRNFEMIPDYIWVPVKEVRSVVTEIYFLP